MLFWTALMTLSPKMYMGHRVHGYGLVSHKLIWDKGHLTKTAGTAAVRRVGM